MRQHFFARQKNAKLAAGLVATAWLFGCTSVSHISGNDTQIQYNAAISDAAVAGPEKIVALLPIPPGPSVAVISWVTEKRLPCQAGEPPCTLTVGADRLWVTLAGEVQHLCRSWNLSGDPLRRRLEQLLGLPLDPPPQFRKAQFVVMEVPRDRIDRPCLGIDDTDPAHPTCTLDGKSGNAVELRNFVGQQMASSYVVGHPTSPGYPYTRLGYTYDWHPAAHARKHYGASEFVVAPNTVARVTAQIATDDYCKAAAY